MPTKHEINEFGFLRLDGRRKTPLFRQLYEQIRSAILQKRIKAACRIPSSRDLMRQLQVSRTTIVTAIDQLISEGYLNTQRGRGTFVSHELPDEQILPVGVSLEHVERCTKASNHLSDYGNSLKQSDLLNWRSGTQMPFCPGEPGLDEFPISVWSKIVRRVWKSVSPFDLSYGEPNGYYPLRSQVAQYLSIHRGVNCETEQVIIVNGTQQAIDIVSRISINRGDQVLIENPGYLSARYAFEKHGAEIIPMPVDENGAMIDVATAANPDARLAFVTPSHQFPLGGTLPIERRLELIQWAQQNKSLILEDDYDSEYRYSQKPLPCLQGLDSSSRTIYVGSFSKVIFPALGLGYAILPPQMVSAFQNALRLSSRPGSQVDQIVLSEFIREGHFVRHLRKMRKIHALRRDEFVSQINKHLSDQLTVVGSSAGLHCTAILKLKTPDTVIAKKVEQHGIFVRPLSKYYVDGTNSKEKQNGLIFGFACVPTTKVSRLVKKLAGVLT